MTGRQDLAMLTFVAGAALVAGTAAGCTENLIPIPSGETDVSTVDATKVLVSALTAGVTQGEVVIAGLPGAATARGMIFVTVDGGGTTTAAAQDNGAFAAGATVSPGARIHLQWAPEGATNRSVAVTVDVVSLQQSGAGSDAGTAESRDGRAGAGGSDWQPNAAPGSTVPESWTWEGEDTLQMNGPAGFANPGDQILVLNGTASVTNEGTAASDGSATVLIPAAPGDVLWLFAQGPNGPSPMVTKQAPPK